MRSPPPELREEIAADFRQRWWVRCLLETEHDRLGLILRAVMGLPTDDAPWLGPSAIVDAHGMILSNWVDEHNHMHFAAGVCTVDDLVGNLRRLVDALQLSRDEADALFAQVRAWIKVDARPHTEQPEDRIPIEFRG